MTGPLRFVGIVLPSASQLDLGHGPWWCGHVHRTAERARDCAAREGRRLLRVNVPADRVAALAAPP